MIFTDLNVRHLFPTPFVTAALPPDMVKDVNSQLADLILRKEAEEPSGTAIGYRGWQSDAQLLQWGGEPVEKVLAALKELLAHITMHKDGMDFRRTYTEWQIEAWAGVIRKGNMDMFRLHPGGYWSAIYYVQADDREDQPVGGDVEIVDPRGLMPIQACPSLCFGIEGYTSAGMSEFYKPKTGQCIIFPSWLAHAVRPYIGDETQIYLSFHFSY